MKQDKGTSLSQLMVQAVHLTPTCFFKLIVPLLFLVVTETLAMILANLFKLYVVVCLFNQKIPETWHPGLGSLTLAFFIWLFCYFCGCYVRLLMIIVSGRLWKNDQINWSGMRKAISLNLLGKFILLNLQIDIFAFLGFLFFIVPGVVYLLKRVFAPIVLTMEKRGINSALQKSIELTTTSRLFDPDGPFRILVVIATQFIISTTVTLGFTWMFSLVNSSTFSLITGTICYALLSAIIACFFAVLLVGLYLDFETRQQAADTGNKPVTLSNYRDQAFGGTSLDLD